MSSHKAKKEDSLTYWERVMRNPWLALGAAILLTILGLFSKGGGAT